MRLNGQPSGQLFPKRWPLRNQNQTKSIINKHKVNITETLTPKQTTENRIRTTALKRSLTNFWGFKLVLLAELKKIQEDFSGPFRKLIIRHKRFGYDINVMRQSAYLVFNPITVDSFAALFSCTPVDRAPHSMMDPTYS